MKIVLNRCFGGFSLSETAVKALGLSSPYSDIERTNPLLIKLVEANPAAASGPYAILDVVEIPDSATDWDIDEYDGAESVIYVVDGKIHYTE